MRGKLVSIPYPYMYAHMLEQARGHTRLLHNKTMCTVSTKHTDKNTAARSHTEIGVIDYQKREQATKQNFCISPDENYKDKRQPK